VHPRALSWRHPIDRARFGIYVRAAGVTDLKQGDGQYLERYFALIGGLGHVGRSLMLAFDQVYDERGQARPELSEFHTPNDYLLSVVARRPDRLVACASVHPYREDALEELERVAARGAVAIKWLPNAQRIDPASPRCDAFYERMVQLGLPLLTHAGQELAVHAAEAQALGNPLRLRRPLERGVKVIVAHCASLGEDEDLDRKGGGTLPSFQLWLRLMDEAAWRGQLYGECSALPQFNRCVEALPALLGRPDLHSRLVNGSDYPLPAVNALFSLDLLAALDLLDRADVPLLSELHRHDPLAFDLVLKHRLRAPAELGGHRLPASIYSPPPTLLPRLALAGLEPPAPPSAPRSPEGP
jgi:mannonate dehydratase